jgi:hypothetical protein
MQHASLRYTQEICREIELVVSMDHCRCCDARVHCKLETEDTLRAVMVLKLQNFKIFEIEFGDNDDGVPCDGVL